MMYNPFFEFSKRRHALQSTPKGKASVYDKQDLWKTKLYLSPLVSLNEREQLVLQQYVFSQQNVVSLIQ